MIYGNSAGGPNNPYLMKTNMANEAQSIDAPVSLTQLPVVNVFDLTRRSENRAILTKGGGLDQLSCTTQADSHLSDQDLVAVEVEVNKKKQKKRKH